MPESPYDGIARWYDEAFAGYADEEGSAGVLAAIVHGLQAPTRVVADIGCGSGLHFGALQARGYEVVGVDLSFDQIRIGRERSTLVATGNAEHLPLADDSFDIAVSSYTHTDFEDFRSVVAEVARILTTGGRFVYLGTHPCFVGPFVKRGAEGQNGRLEFAPGYGETERVFDGSGTSGLKKRVGSRNLPLGDFLDAFLAAGLVINAFDELDGSSRRWHRSTAGGAVLPWNVAIVASNPGQGGGR